MCINHIQSNETMSASWYLLVEMRLRTREINSTAIREYVIVDWSLFCCKTFTGIWKYLEITSLN